MTLMISPLADAHLDDAARLVTERAERSGLPAPDPGLRAAVRDALQRMDLSDGFVATRSGEVAGFLVGISARLFNGLPGVFVPEIGHASGSDTSVYGPLYRTAAERWLGQGRATHAIALFSGDREGLAAWASMDFGTHLIDGVRRVATLTHRVSGEGVRFARESDLDDAVRMDEATMAHLRASPVFLAHRPKDRETVRARLADPERPVLVAEVDDRVVGWMTASLCSDAPLVMARLAPMLIDGAYVEPAFRSGGIGVTLVESMLAWAADQGHEWVAVDYETANLEAAVFWPGCGFEPVLTSLARTIATPESTP